MYIAKIVQNGLTEYIIRESFLDREIYRSRDLVKLTDHPAAYVKYLMERSFYIDSRITDQLEAVSGTVDYDDVETIFWPYVRADIKRKYNFSQSKGQAAPKPSELKQTPHIFDKRRLIYLKGGNMNQRNITALDEKYFYSLHQKSRDEIEQHFMLMEKSLPVKEIKNYIYVIFDLQRHFKAPFAREMPEAINPEKVDQFFLENICRINNDTSLWQETVSKALLNDYLKRYVIYFFDHDYLASTYLNDREFEKFNKRRYYRQTKRSTDIVYSEASRVFGLSEPELKKMTKRELKKLFRKKAQALHPDKGGDHDTFVKLSAIFEELMMKK